MDRTQLSSRIQQRNGQELDWVRNNQYSAGPLDRSPVSQGHLSREATAGTGKQVKKIVDPGLMSLERKHEIVPYFSGILVN